MGLEAIPLMIASIGAAARGVAKDLKDATAAANEYAAAAGQQTTGGMYAQREGSSSLSASATSLGDPRNGPDQMIKLYEAVEAAKRGR